MARADDEYQPRHAALPEELGDQLKEENIAADEATGTPPHISAKVRTAVYVGCLTFNALCLVVFGLLPIFGALDAGKAAQAMNVIITAVNLVSTALAVGYRPTRPGSPIKP